MSKKHKTTKHVPHKHEHKTTHHSHNKNDEQDIKDLQDTLQTAKKIFWNEKTLIVLLLIIAIGLSTFFRMYPATLPITDQWAEDTYYNQVRSGLLQQINAQYPNLPSAQKNEYVETELQKYIEANEAQLGPQIQQTSDYFKSRMQTEDGQTYLLAIDPYVWLSNAKNIKEYGMVGDELVNDKVSFSLRRGQEPKYETATLHPHMIVLGHNIGKIFNKNFDILKSSFYLPVLLIALAIIPAFFLGRKIAGNLGGFISGLIIAINTALLGRTPAGFSDTDAYIVLFPLLISWLFIESLTAKKLRDKLLFMGGAGLSYALFRFAWQQSWHIGAILLGVAGIYFLYTIIMEWSKIQQINPSNILQNNSAQIVITTILFLVSIFIFSGLITSSMGTQDFTNSATNSVKQIFIQPLSALSVKDVAGADIWPNVLTTVAELNEGSWAQIIGSLGGKLFFVIGIIGILLTFTLKTEHKTFEIRYAALIGLWSLVLIAASLMSARFIALLAAPFAIAFGAAFGILWKHMKLIKSKDLLIIGRVTLVILVGILFITPISQAHKVGLQEVPSMNDAWYDSLITIKNDSEDGIITSWWDFGHWFVNIAERRVTFDGGDQGKRIYWVGKSLMTENLEENKAILRMLNCGQNVGYERLVEYTNNNYQASQLINSIIYEDKETASAQLTEAGLTQEEITAVLEKTHCSNDELLPQYYIASQDMIGKAGVWAHFGGWNFDRAHIYNIAKNNEYDQAIAKMNNELGLSEEEASQLYFEANSLTNNRKVDNWISPWPSYITSSAKGCTIENNQTIVCSLNQGLGSQNGAQIVLDRIGLFMDDPTNMSMNILTYQNGQIVGETLATPAKLTINQGDEWETYEFENPSFPYEIVIGQDKNGNYKAIAAEDAVADSAFTKLFFFDGQGMTGYEQISDETSFRGERILVYKVDLNN